MKGHGWLRGVLALNVAIILVVLAYRAYLDLFVPPPDSIHAEQVERIQSRLTDADSVRFALVGNINNSIGIFERQIVPRLNASGVDFVISAGNAVRDGGADKYRALRESLERLEIPYLVAFGQNESDGLGAFRYYRRFGPHFFGFRAGGVHFVFLDPTGQTSDQWQIRWLEELLVPAPGSPDSPVVLVSALPLVAPESPSGDPDDDTDLAPREFRASLLDLARQHGVAAVLSGTLPRFDDQLVRGTRHVTSGGAGGLLLGDDTGVHHWVEVTITGDRLRVRAHPLDTGQGAMTRTLENTWLWIHSLFFTGYLNFLLLVSVLVLVAYKLHGLVYVDRDYYPRFDTEPTRCRPHPLRVAIFTNTYRPFIGGVPISIDRLRTGLETLGDQTLVAAPSYPTADPDDNDRVVRSGALLAFGDEREFRIANIFRPSVWRRVRDFAPDIIHVHQPFWMGSLGLWMARRLDVPCVFTYHTRLEHYAHMVPIPGRLFRNLIAHWLVRRFANKCDGVVVPTVSAREYLGAIGVRTRIVVQPTGVDIEAFRCADRDRVSELRSQVGNEGGLVLLSVSRLSEEKNLDFLLDGMDRVRRRVDHDVRLVLIGDGPERSRLAERIERDDLESNIILAGAVPPDDLPPHYLAADLFVFSSLSETQGMVILEAMAAGLPVVAIRSSGIDDLLVDGTNGFKTADNLEEWTDRVCALLQDPELRRAMSDEALDTARKHDLESVARAMTDFYALILANQAAAESSGGRVPPGATEPTDALAPKPDAS